MLPFLECKWNKATVRSKCKMPGGCQRLAGHCECLGSLFCHRLSYLLRFICKLDNLQYLLEHTQN